MSGGRRTSRTGTNYRARRQRHPVGGQVVLPLEPGSVPTSLRMEDPYPLKGARIRLLDAAGERVAEVPADHRGTFGFTPEQLGGRDPAQLALEVVAWNHGRLRVCYESSQTPWTFRVGAIEVEGAQVDVAEPLGPRMRLEVPELARRAVRVHDEQTGRLTAGTEQHRVRRAFFAFCLLLEMRAFYWREGSKDRRYPRASGATVIYPANTSTYRPLHRTIYLDGYDDPNGDGGNRLPELGAYRYDFSASWAAHEFGHHLFAMALPDARYAEGAHTWERREALPEGEGGDYQGFIEGLALDFSEGYATFVAQAFLRHRIYTEGVSASGNAPGQSDLEHPGCSSGLGDGATAGYLWDLIDHGSEAGDDLHLTFAQVHGALASYGPVLGTKWMSLPSFHDHLLTLDALGLTRESLERNLERNDLLPVYRTWKPIAEHSDQV